MLKLYLKALEAGYAVDPQFKYIIVEIKQISYHIFITKIQV